MIEKFDEMGGGGWITTTDLSLGDAEEPDPKILRESIHKSIKEASLRSFTASSTKVSKLKSRTYGKATDRAVASLGKIDEDEQDEEEGVPHTSVHDECDTRTTCLQHTRVHALSMIRMKVFT